METDINSTNTSQPLSQTNQIPNQPIVEPKNNKLVKVLLYTIGAIVFMAIGAFGYGYFQNKREVITTPETNLPTQQVQPTLSSQPTTVPTSNQVNWKTYSNSIFKYSIKYPSDWDKLEADNGNYARFFKGTYSPNLPTPETYISILPKDNPSNKTVREWLISEGILPDPNNISTHIQEKNVTVGGISAIQILTPVNGGQETIYLPVGNKILQITYIFKGEGLDEYDKLVQTFHQMIDSLSF